MARYMSCYLSKNFSYIIFTFSGKDITHKLYSVSEGLSGAIGTDRDLVPAHLTRSASVDAVHEGARGQLRSLNWRTKSQKKQGIGQLFVIFCINSPKLLTYE